MPPLIIVADKVCEQCGASYNRGTSPSGRREGLFDYRKRRFCSRACYFHWNTGGHHWYWRGGVKRRPDGYVRRSSDDQYVHRTIMEQHLGRPLRSDEVVHHKNGDTSDNQIANLMVLTNAEHRKLHVKGRSRDREGRWCHRV